MTNFSLTFNHDFSPNNWDPELEHEFGIQLNERCDLRLKFPFLYAAEQTLSDISSGKISSWDLDNILINEKNYSITIKKGAHLAELKLVITNNQINLLEQKISKQNIQLNDPYHWTKTIKNESISDIGFLKILCKSLKTPIHNIESICLNKTPKVDEDLKQFKHELKILKDLMSMTENYLKRRTDDTK